MRVGQPIAFAIAFSAVSSVALAAAGPKDEDKNVQQVPLEQTAPGTVTGQTPSADPGGVKRQDPTFRRPGDRPDSQTVTPPGHRTPGAPSGAAAAAEPRDTFGELDKDQSGYLEESEAGQVGDLDFQSADTDGDGKLSASEFEAAPGASGSESGASPRPGPGADPGKPDPGATTR